MQNYFTSISTSSCARKCHTTPARCNRFCVVPLLGLCGARARLVPHGRVGADYKLLHAKVCPFEATSSNIDRKTSLHGYKIRIFKVSGFSPALGIQ